MFKEYRTSKHNFLKGWYIPEKICDNLISYFHTHIEKAQPGRTAHVLNKKIKDSVDLRLGEYNKDSKIVEYRNVLQKILERYIKIFPELHKTDRFNVEDLLIQKYPKKGGFKTWHYERSSKITSSRILVFMTYLNNVRNGGTCFKYQQLITPARKGLTLIWPCDFTHTHKGQISNEEKIIITGWFKFI